MKRELPALAQETARSEASFADFLERVPACEQAAHGQRYCRTLTGLLAVKTPEQFDWAAAGALKAQSQEIANLAFVGPAENVLLLGHSGGCKTHITTTPNRPEHKTRLPGVNYLDR